MTRQETGIIMDILTTAYPRFYAGPDAPDMRKTINLWASMFADDPVEIVAAAVKALISSDEKGFPPSIGAIKGYIRRITQQDEMTEAEAWNVVQKAISRGIYNSKEEFDKLPPVLQRLVGGPSQLRDWAMMDSYQVQSVVASNFQRSYRKKAASEREYLALPPDVRALADKLGKRLALNGGAQSDP